MSKISIVESYINSCAGEHTMDSAKKLVNDILGVTYLGEISEFIKSM